VAHGLLFVLAVNPLAMPNKAELDAEWNALLIEHRELAREFAEWKHQRDQLSIEEVHQYLLEHIRRLREYHARLAAFHEKARQSAG
jgi:hypothetical protein